MKTKYLGRTGLQVSEICLGTMTFSVIVYNPLAGGMLTGRYQAGQAPQENTRFTLRNAGSSTRLVTGTRSS
jgi:aryl-alcohol dehydrogenase-like predicted oxidoreductase